MLRNEEAAVLRAKPGSSAAGVEEEDKGTLCRGVTGALTLPPVCDSVLSVERQIFSSGAALAFHSVILRGDAFLRGSWFFSAGNAEEPETVSIWEPLGSTIFRTLKHLDNSVVSSLSPRWVDAPGDVKVRAAEVRVLAGDM